MRGVDFITLFTCVDVPYAAPQEAGPSQQSDQIACGRDVSGFVIVSVALAHPNRHPVPALVVHAHCLRVLNLKGEPTVSHLPSIIAFLMCFNKPSASLQVP